MVVYIEGERLAAVQTPSWGALRLEIPSCRRSLPGVAAKGGVNAPLLTSIVFKSIWTSGKCRG